MAFEDLVGRLVLDKKYHLGAAETRDSVNERKSSTAAAATFGTEHLPVCRALCQVPEAFSPRKPGRKLLSVSSPFHRRQQGLRRVK